MLSLKFRSKFIAVFGNLYQTKHYAINQDRIRFDLAIRFSISMLNQKM